MIVWNGSSGTLRGAIGIITQMMFLIGGGMIAARHAYRAGLKVRIAGLITVLSVFFLLASICWGVSR